MIRRQLREREEKEGDRGRKRKEQKRPTKEGRKGKNSSSNLEISRKERVVVIQQRSGMQTGGRWGQKVLWTDSRQAHCGRLWRTVDVVTVHAVWVEWE